MSTPLRRRTVRAPGRMQLVDDGAVSLRAASVPVIPRQRKLVRVHAVRSGGSRLSARLLGRAGFPPCDGPGRPDVGRRVDRLGADGGG